MKEIAQLAGVSRGTVDRVLNNRGDVNEATANKVREIARAVNYTPSLAGKTLAARKKQLKFGYILFSGKGANPFFADVVRGIQGRAKELEDYGVSVEIRYAAIDNPDLQVRLIDELLAEGIDGLAITPINHTAVRRRLMALCETGFPVVTVNSDIPDCGRIAYVGSNYHQSGETAAGLLHLICAGRANVGVIMGSPWVLCHSERVEGFSSRVKACYPGIHIVARAANNDDDIESYAVTLKLLQEHPQIDALYLAAAGIAGACRAVEELGKLGKVKVLCYDIIPTTGELMDKNAISAAITQQPYTQGAKPLGILFDLVGMGLAPEEEYHYTKIEIKIRENIAV